jgi:hypothetical protein
LARLPVASDALSVAEAYLQVYLLCKLANDALGLL